jgi:hypothetical protein
MQVPDGDGSDFQRIRVDNGTKHETAARTVGQGRNDDEAHVRRKATLNYIFIFY